MKNVNVRLLTSSLTTVDKPISCQQDKCPIVDKCDNFSGLVNKVVNNTFTNQKHAYLDAVDNCDKKLPIEHLEIAEKSKTDTCERLIASVPVYAREVVNCPTNGVNHA